MSFLFGGSKAPQINYTPSGISNPSGFNVSGSGNISNSDVLNASIGSLSSTFGSESGALGGLARTVQPGFSQFRQAGLRDISNTFRAARSNLKDTLAQRRILGSSFANSQFSQQAADEAQAKSNFEAQSYLQELQASYQLIQSQYETQAKSYSTFIDQSNIESSIAANLTANNNRIGASIAEANAQLTAQAQAGAGSFLGTLLGVGANAFGGRGLFSSGGIFGGASAGGNIAADASIFNTSMDSILADIGTGLAVV